jgi:hypothetical protein
MDATALSDEEFAQRGNALFDERVRPNVDLDEEAHKFVAIDVETGAYAVHKQEREATKQLLEQQPEAKGRIWFRRVGSESAHHLGASLKFSESRSS